MEKEYTIGIKQRSYGTVDITYDVTVLNKDRQPLAWRYNLPDEETLQFVSQFFADEATRIQKHKGKL